MVFGIVFIAEWCPHLYLLFITLIIILYFLQYYSDDYLRIIMRTKKEMKIHMIYFFPNFDSNSWLSTCLSTCAYIYDIIMDFWINQYCQISILDNAPN